MWLILSLEYKLLTCSVLMQLGSLLLHQFNLMTLLSFKILLFMEGTKSVVNPLYDYFGLILNYAIKYYQYVPSLFVKFVERDFSYLWVVSYLLKCVGDLIL